MSTQTPNGLVPLLYQPVMSHGLRVHVMDFKAAMMDMWRLLSRGKFDAKESMVINKVVTAIDMGEHSYVDLLTIAVSVQNIGRHKVEVLRVEVEHGVKIADDKPVMTKLRTKIESDLILVETNRVHEQRTL